MRSVVRVLVVGGLVLVLGSFAWAAEGKKKHVRPEVPRPEMGRMNPFGLVSRLNLSEEQKAKIEELRKEYEPKLAELRAKLDSILTEDQKKAREEAIRKAKEAGKTGRELAEAIRNAFQLTEEQQNKMKEARSQMGQLVQEIREKLMGILTDEQKAELKKLFGEGRPKGPKPESKQ